MLFKYRKWSLNSIAAYYSLARSFVLQILNNFELRAGQKEDVCREFGQKTWKITKNHIETIGRFMIKNRGKYITVEDI